MERCWWISLGSPSTRLDSSFSLWSHTVSLSWCWCSSLPKTWSLLLWTYEGLLLLLRQESVFLTLACLFSSHFKIPFHLMVFSTLFLISFNNNSFYPAMFYDSISCVNSAVLQFVNSVDKCKARGTTMHSRIWRLAFHTHGVWIFTFL